MIKPNQIFIIAVLLLISCKADVQLTTQPPTPQPISTLTSMPTKPLSVTPSAAPISPTITFAPSASPTPRATATPTATPIYQVRIETGEVESIAWSPDGEILAIGTTTGIHFFDLKSLREVQFIQTNELVQNMAFSPDGNYLASSNWDEPKVSIWVISNGELFTTFQGEPLHPGYVAAGIKSLAFHPKGQILAVASDATRYWSVENGNQKQLIDEDSKWVRDIAFSPDGEILATAGGYNGYSVRLRNAQTGELLHTLVSITEVHSVAFSADGTILVSSNDLGYVELWNTLTGDLLSQSDTLLTPQTIITMSHDGQHIAESTWHSRVIVVWNQTLSEKTNSFFHDAGIKAIEFNPINNVLASVSYDNTVKLWDVDQNKLIGVIAAP